MKANKKTGLKDNNNDELQELSPPNLSPCKRRAYYRKGLFLELKEELSKPDHTIKHFAPGSLKKYLNLQKALDQFIEKKTPPKEE